jgi:hypothetical protein
LWGETIIYTYSGRADDNSIHNVCGVGTHNEAVIAAGEPIDVEIRLVLLHKYEGACGACKHIIVVGRDSLGMHTSVFSINLFCLELNFFNSK